MKMQNKISIRGILAGVILAILSYFIIAILNVSNEDIYGWNIKKIFQDGGAFNVIALLLFWAWFIITAIWLTVIAIRLIKNYMNR